MEGSEFQLGCGYGVEELLKPSEKSCRLLHHLGKETVDYFVNDCASNTRRLATEQIVEWTNERMN